MSGESTDYRSCSLGIVDVPVIDELVVECVKAEVNLVVADKISVTEMVYTDLVLTCILGRNLFSGVITIGLSKGVPVHL